MCDSLSSLSHVCVFASTCAACSTQAIARSLALYKHNQILVLICTHKTHEPQTQRSHSFQAINVFQASKSTHNSTHSINNSACFVVVVVFIRKTFCYHKNTLSTHIRTSCSLAMETLKTHVVQHIPTHTNTPNTKHMLTARRKNTILYFVVSRICISHRVVPCGVYLSPNEL